MLFLHVVIFSLPNTWNSLLFHCSNACRVGLVAIMEAVWFCMLYIAALPRSQRGAHLRRWLRSRGTYDTLSCPCGCDVQCFFYLCLCLCSHVQFGFYIYAVKLRYICEMTKGRGIFFLREVGNGNVKRLITAQRKRQFCEIVKCEIVKISDFRTAKDFRN